MLTERTLITSSGIHIMHTILKQNVGKKKTSPQKQIYTSISATKLWTFFRTLLSRFIRLNNHVAKFNIILATSMVVQWVTLLPHSSRPEFCTFSPWVLWFHPTSKNCRWIDSAKLPQVWMNCVMDSCHIQDPLPASHQTLTEDEWMNYILWVSVRSV